jgi:hypothetical protein
MVDWAYDDFVTGERLQALADVTVLTHSVMAFHKSLPASGVLEAVAFPGTHTELAPDERGISALRGRKSIFVYTHLLRSFVARVLPRLDHAFVLVTHNSDDPVGDEYLPVLADPRIIHWFAQNCLVRHPKLTPLPIGVANAHWPHGDLQALLRVANAPRRPQEERVYVNFEVRTNPAVRGPLRARLEASPLAWLAPSRPFGAYLVDMAGCRWVLSPPGNGVDCHRTWEALYLGATPIVARTPHGAPLHDGLPVVQLDDLGAIDESGLKSAGPPAPDAHQLDRLRMSHWRRLVRQALSAGA